MISKGNSSVSYIDILDSVSEEALLHYYFNITTIPCLINAPYREDKKPSVGIFYSNNSILFKDFATYNHGNIIELFKLTWNCNYFEVLNRINKDLYKINNNATIYKKETYYNKKHIITSSSIKVKTREWKQYDLDYWESYGVSLSWLKFGDIYPISHIFLYKNNKELIFPADKYAYVYVENKDNILSYKIYQPFNIKQKWLNKHNASVWDLWTKLPEKGENLIITSSRKDALCIWENTLIPSVSLQGEGYIPKKEVINQLKNRFDKVFILYDNDFKSTENHGHIFGNKLASLFDLYQIEIPTEYQSKDPSDLCKNFNRQKVKEVISTLVATPF